MITERLTPGVVRAALIGTAVTAFLYSLASRTVMVGKLGDWMLGFLMWATAAHAVALMISARLVREYRVGSKMRLAWWLIALSNAAGLARHVHECVLISIGMWDHPAFGLRQILIVTALMLLLAGLGVMWVALASAGIGLKILKRDVAILAALLIVVPAALLFERHETDLHSPFALVRMLNLITPYFFAAIAGAGLLLYRASLQMGEGQLARSLRYLAIFIGLRLVLILLTILPGREFGTPLLDSLLYSMTYTVSWFLALAMAERWQLTLQAMHKMKDFD